MSQEPVLRVRQLSKCFKLYNNPWLRSREWITRRKCHQPFWALQDASFDVYPSECLGVIGQNGAGKSTLLKLLTGALQPTVGQYEVQGRILSLLELGTDFNDHLTGQENLWRSAELLGFPAGYIRDRLPDIIAFAELGDFLNRPIRIYSSGMKARLAFALFAFLDCEVLILDEVLAVGDIFFRQKCFDRLAQLLAKGTAILLVTHDMSAIHQYCDRVLLLDQGKVCYEGDARVGIQHYFDLKQPAKVAQSATPKQLPSPPRNASMTVQPSIPWPSETAFTRSSLTTSQAALVRTAVCDDAGAPSIQFNQGQDLHLYGEFDCKSAIEVPVLLVQVTNQYNVLVHGKASLQQHQTVPLPVTLDAALRFYQRLTLNLELGEYILGVTLYNLRDASLVSHLHELTMADLMQIVDPVLTCPQIGYIQLLPPVGQQLSTHFGICDLPGDCRLQVVAPLSSV